jgi:hypothetical protein
MADDKYARFAPGYPHGVLSVLSQAFGNYTFRSFAELKLEIDSKVNPFAFSSLQEALSTEQRITE